MRFIVNGVRLGPKFLQCQPAKLGRHESGNLYVGPNEKVVTYLQIDEDGPVNGNTEPYQGYEVQYGAIETPDYGFPSDNGGSYYCKTSFTIVNGEITDYTFNGDDCVANN